MKSEGFNTSINRVQNLMKLLNLKSTRCLQKSHPQSADNSQYYVNKLRRVFNQTAPNKYLVSIVTEVKAGRNKFYLYAILDLFPKKVIDYIPSSQNTANITIDSLRMLLSVETGL